MTTATSRLHDNALQVPIRIGIFDTVEAADAAVHGLLAAGFTPEQITVVCSDDAKERYFRQFEHQDPAGTHTPRNALVGGAIGATLGGLAAVGGAMATGGLSLLATAGIAAWAGGVFGGLVGAMSARGIEKELANYYQQAVLDGKILVAAEDETPSRSRTLPEAARILEEAGAHPIALPEG
jgi:hypothetical protein